VGSARPNHSLGGEGKEGGERATRLLPGEQPPRLLSCSPHLPVLLLFSLLLLLPDQGALRK